MARDHVERRLSLKHDWKKYFPKIAKAKDQRVIDEREEVEYVIWGMTERMKKHETVPRTSGECEVYASNIRVLRRKIERLQELVRKLKEGEEEEIQLLEDRPTTSQPVGVPKPKISEPMQPPETPKKRSVGRGRGKMCSAQAQSSMPDGPGQHK